MMHLADMPPDLRALFERYHTLTGIQFRLIGDDQARQGFEFLKSFTMEELDLVVKWTKWMIGKGANGYSQASLQWKVIMGQYGAGDMFQTFQERLGMAQEAIKRKALRNATAGAPATPSNPRPEPDAVEAERIRKKTAEQFRDFKL